MANTNGIALRVEVLDGTDIEDAYDGIRELSNKLGGVKVLTNISGVRMLYYGQSEAIFEKEYVIRRLCDEGYAFDENGD